MVVAVWQLQTISQSMKKNDNFMLEIIQSEVFWSPKREESVRIGFEMIQMYLHTVNALQRWFVFKNAVLFYIKHDTSDGIFTVLYNDWYNEWGIDRTRSAFKFLPNRQQPQICSFICLEVMLIWKYPVNHPNCEKVWQWYSAMWLCRDLRSVSYER